MRRVFILLVFFLAILGSSAIYAQDDTLEPVRVEATAGDGLTLVADYYAPAGDESVSAIILFHMLSSERSAWEPLLPILVNDYGFAVLNVDMRGHGETGGERDWAHAETDVQVWIDWLRQQESIASVSLVGASIGSNLAIRGWANDPDIATAVALSPGLDYRGVTTADAVEAAADRPIMLVAARDDVPSAQAVNQLYDLTTGYATVRMYEGSLHGTRMFSAENHEFLLYAIAAWVAENS